MSLVVARVEKNSAIPFGITERLLFHPAWPNVEAATRHWIDTPLFKVVKDEKHALALVKTSLAHTYLFGRYTLPSYMAHACFSLRNHPPTDNAAGEILIQTTNLFMGEIANNNIFGAPSDCHAHYWDMLLCYRKAGLDMNLVDQFDEIERAEGFERAIKSSALWSQTMVEYAQTVIKATENPLATFVIGLISEKAIPEGYKVILRGLPNDDKFLPFKQFLLKHIEHDEKDHSPTTVAWVNRYIGTRPMTSGVINEALQLAIEFVERRIETYPKQ